MSWSTYWKGQVDAIDETEKQTESAWKEALVVLLLGERWMRRGSVRGAMGLPSVRGGWIDTSKRDAMRIYRAKVRRDAEYMTRQIRIGLGAGGRGGDSPVIGYSRRLPPGPLRIHLDDVIDRVPPVVIPDPDIDDTLTITPIGD